MCRRTGRRSARRGRPTRAGGARRRWRPGRWRRRARAFRSPAPPGNPAARRASGCGCANIRSLCARLVAEALRRHPKVERLTWPGLPEHPQHALARKQMKGFGGMLTFVIKGGLPAARSFLKALRLFTVAESLGGVESLIEHPAIMTHASVPLETRKRLGIDDGFIRLSVGIEN